MRDFNKRHESFDTRRHHCEPANLLFGGRGSQSIKSSICKAPLKQSSQAPRRMGLAMVPMNRTLAASNHYALCNKLPHIVPIPIHFLVNMQLVVWGISPSGSRWKRPAVEWVTLGYSWLFRISRLQFRFCLHLIQSYHTKVSIKS